MVRNNQEKKRNIVMFHPFMPETAIHRIKEILDSRWIGQGPKVDEFEAKLKEKFGFKYPVTVNTGTAALRLALSISGVGPGDEVITTAQTCTATNHPILEQFAKPVFADVQYETGNIDPNDIARRITDKTKAIICVHWAGYPCDMQEIHKIAKQHNVPVIEDAAHAIGATYKGERIGNISDFTAFSLQAIKQITTGDGGILTTNHEDHYKAALRRRWYGIDKATRIPSILGHAEYDITEVGYKYTMNDIAAAIGIEQLNHFDNIIKRRTETAERYREEFKKIPKITLFEQKQDRISSHWIFTMHVKDRLKFIKMMQEKGIETSVVHLRNDRYTIFGGLRKDLPNLDKYSETNISIPIHNKLTDDDIDYIIKCVKQGW